MPCSNPAFAATQSDQPRRRGLSSTRTIPVTARGEKGKLRPDVAALDVTLGRDAISGFCFAD